MINFTLQGHVGVVELDRPERRNALDVEHCHALREAVDKAVAAGARTVMIAGAGKCFCSGADLGEVYGEGFREALYGALDSIVEAPVPVVAAVNGPAIGAGTQLALAADLRIAADDAAFAIPSARLGLAVDPSTVRRLMALAGAGTARAMLLACKTIRAEHAYVRGLVDRLGDRDVALRWAQEMATFAPLSLAYSKQAVNLEEGVPGTYQELMAAYESVWRSEDAVEGRRAHTEKRPPHFRGR
jgi:enoyl-CoA hydratase